MSAPAAKRFYQDVTVQPVEGGFGIALDQRKLKTPGKAPLVLPNAILAEAIAEEWRAQGETIVSAGMPLTRLANTAIDRAAAHRADILAQLLAFGTTDLVCYRAEAPADLVERQAEAWDPVLRWLDDAFGARLAVGQGIGFVKQDDVALAALRQELSSIDDFHLTGLYSAAALLGSLSLALALDAGRMNALEAFATAHLDEAYQAEKWGDDWEAKEWRVRKYNELNAIASFLEFIHSPVGMSGTA